MYIHIQFEAFLMMTKRFRGMKDYVLHVTFNIMYGLMEKYCRQFEFDATHHFWVGNGEGLVRC